MPTPKHPHTHTPAGTFLLAQTPVAASTSHPLFPWGGIPCYSEINPEKQAGFSVQNTLLGSPGLPNFYRRKAEGFNWGSNSQSPYRIKEEGHLTLPSRSEPFRVILWLYHQKKRDFLFILRPHEVKVIQELNSFQVLRAFYPYSLIRYFYLLHKSKIFFLSVSVTHDIMENEAESKAIEKKSSFP